MQRRHFLRSAAAIGAAACLPPAFGRAAPASRFSLLYAASAVPGTPFVPFAAADCTACGADALRVFVDGLHAATGSPVLADFTLTALFDTLDGGRVPFLAWQAAGDNRHRTRFVAPRAGMRGFELSYRAAGASADTREALAMTRVDARVLMPGHYLIVSPRRDGSAVDARGLVHSGHPLQPLAEAGDFDYLALRMEAIA